MMQNTTLKQSTRHAQRGIGHLLVVLLIAVVLAVIGGAAYAVNNKNKNKTADSSNASASTPTASSAEVKDPWPTDTNISWVADGRGGWISLPYDTKPPACPDPIQIQSPTKQIDKATAVLYPGQTRSGSFEGLGGNYKPHGGLRFDKATDVSDVSVEMPFNGSVFRGSRYLIGGEIQYTFDIVNACGVMVRIGHLRELSPEFQAIADKFPAAVEGNSQTTKVEPAMPFKTGDPVAKAVGFKSTKPVNVFFDFGLYDLRSNNEASKDASYQQAHKDAGELSFHGLCWLNNLNSKDQTFLKTLPGGDKDSGKKSDYCK